MLKTKLKRETFHLKTKKTPNKCGVLRNLVSFVQFKKHEIIHGGVLLLVKMQASTCNFTKSNTPPWVFLTFFKLYKWYQIAQSVSYSQQHIII